jgi:hypothetical protein
MFHLQKKNPKRLRASGSFYLYINLINQLTK